VFSYIGKRIYDHLRDKYSTSMWYVIGSVPLHRSEKPAFSAYHRRWDVADYSAEVGRRLTVYSFDRNDMTMSGNACHPVLNDFYSNVMRQSPGFRELDLNHTSFVDDCKSAQQISSDIRKHIVKDGQDFIIDVIPHHGKVNNNTLF